MKRYSRLAILSFVLACTGGWCALASDAPFPAAFILALGSIVLGAGSLRSLRRAATPLRGRFLAVAAVWLGTMTMVAMVAGFMGLLMRQMASQRGFQQNWSQNGPGAEVQVRNGMPDDPAANFTSSLPIVILDTAGQALSKDNPAVVRARFFDAQNRRASINATPQYEGLATIHLRGYSTLRLPKRSFTLHTVDKATNQTKVPLLGLPAEEDWVLYAPFEDKTLIRDVLAYELARRMGHYAPRTRHVELFLHGTRRPLSMRDYAGVYVLVEKVKRGKDRVNIAKLGPTDRSAPEITGGYIIKRDHSEGGDSRFRTRQGGPYSYVYPKAARISPEQKRWIKEYLNSFESALHGPGFADRETGYAAFLDVDSFIDMHWLVEMSKNVDGFRYSAYLTKDRGGRLKPEPPWDWNRSFGNANYYGGGQPQGWYWTNLRPNEMNWYRRLREDPEFARRCTARWRELRKEVYDPKKINARIDELAASLDEAQRRNFRRWPVLGRQITCNHYVGDSFQEEVSWLKKWVERRVAWIDGQLDKRPE